MRLHGAGARSLASLQVQGVHYRRRLGVDGPTIKPHPVTLVEEPEAHLHPQAEFELAELLLQLPGQVIASTHSSHLATVVEPTSIRLLRTKAGHARLIDLGPSKDDEPNTPRARRPSTHASEMEKLKRLAERPFGELLFAQAIVIGDGATERAFLPPVIRYATGSGGVCVVDPESLGSPIAYAAIKFANLAEIPWLIFSDADGPGKAAANKLISTLGNNGQSHIVWIDTDAGSGVSAIESLLIAFDGDLCKKACTDLRPDIDQNLSALDVMTSMKGAAGAVLGRGFVRKHPELSTWPQPLQTLVARLEDKMNDD